MPALIAATIWSLLLPPVKKTIYFHQELEYKETYSSKTKNAFRLMKAHFTESFSNLYVLKWSFWWALATCGFIQVQTYQQVLWGEVRNEDDPNQTAYNGAVEAVLTVLGFLGAMLAGVLKVDWTTKGELTLTVISLLSGFILLLSSRTKYIVVCYICYIAFGGLYHFMITIASAEVAKNIQEDSYGLVFGLITFVAIAFQSLLTAVVVKTTFGYALSTRDQYFVYAFYHIVISVVYIVIGLTTWLKSKRDYQNTD